MFGERTNMVKLVNMCNSLWGNDCLIVWQEKPTPYFGYPTLCNLLNFPAKSCTHMIFKDCLNMLALCTLGFHYEERKALGMVERTKIQQKESWPKVHCKLYSVPNVDT